MKMNIVLLSSNITNAGGTERIGIGLANELINSGASSVTIISFFGSNTPFFDVDKRIRIITLFQQEVPLFILFPKLIWKLRRIFKRCPERSIVLNIGALLCPFSIVANVGLSHRNIVWEHFNVSLIFKSSKERFARYMASRYADAIVTLTLKDREMYLANFACKPKVSAIPNFLTLEMKSNPDLKSNKVALAVGRFTEQKAFDRLIKIWSKLPTHLQDWRLDIVGDGEDEAILKELIADLKLGNVHLIKTTSTIEDHYEEASIYLMTSRWEGLPMVLIEAQSYGLPIISYDCLTGPRDIVRDGYNGYLVPDDQDEEFVTTLIHIMENDKLREKFSLAAREDSTRFNKTAVIESWLQLFKSI